MNKNEDFSIGHRHDWGGESAFGFSVRELRHHCYVVGKKGSGKTTLLSNLILQLAEAGHGVGLIDPHGDLAEGLLDHLSPARAEQTTYFCPADAEFPIGLNLLAQASSDDRHLVASGVVGAFKNLWPDSWGPRMEYILHNAVATLAACPDTSLLGVNRLLTDADYRRWIVDQLEDPTEPNNTTCAARSVAMRLTPSAPPAPLSLPPSDKSPDPRSQSKKGSNVVPHHSRMLPSR